jgi:hypothetical protein
VADSKPPPPLYLDPHGDERESKVPSELRLLIPERKLKAPNSKEIIKKAIRKINKI